MPKTNPPTCQYTQATHHSTDRTKVFCGRDKPVTLCGFHASQPLTPILATITDAATS